MRKGIENSPARTPAAPLRRSTASRLSPAAAISLGALLAGSLAAGEEAGGEAPAAARDGGGHRSLDAWTFEPVALESSDYLFHMDRRDSSFFLLVRRSGVKHFSSWTRKGFCSLRLAGGEVVPVDRVEALDARSERIRFRAASSEQDVPEVWIEWRSGGPGSPLVLRFEVPEESHDDVAAVRILDEALWVGDAETGGFLLPRGAGEWIEPGTAGETLRLSGFPLAREDEGAYSLPAAGIERQGGTLVACWEDPRTVLEVSRREIAAGEFPGRRGLFLSVEVPGPSGEVRLLPPLGVELERMEIPRAYRAHLEQAGRLETLRFKTGEPPELRSFLGAAIARLRVADPPRPPHARGSPRHSFAEAGRIAEHWKQDLEIDQALFILDDWMGVDPEEDGRGWTAAPECGGNEGLSALSRRLRESGFLLGLALDLAQLQEGPDRSAGGAWQAAARFVQDEGLEPLDELYSPHLILVRDAPRGDGELDWSSIRDARATVGRSIAETFGLAAMSPGWPVDVQTAALLDGHLDRKLRHPASAAVYPFFLGAFGESVRLSALSSDGLGPGDAAAFLACLIYGQMAAYELPPHLYFEGGGAAPSGPEGCFARDDGWSSGRGLNARDIFIKNTWEVLSPVGLLSARSPLAAHRFLTPDGGVQESYFGPDLRVLVNFSSTPYEDEESDTVLPQYGFLVRHPFFLAFHASRFGGLTYPEPAFHTVTSLEGKLYLRAESVRLYRGFGPHQLRLGGKVFEVERELETRLW